MNFSPATWCFNVGIIVPRDAARSLVFNDGNAACQCCKWLKVLFEKLPWFVMPRASLWAHHAERDGQILLDVEANIALRSCRFEISGEREGTEVDVLTAAVKTEAVKTIEQLCTVFVVETTTLKRSRQFLEMLLSLNYSRLS